jgi:hypothetical protein
MPLLSNILRQLPVRNLFSNSYVQDSRTASHNFLYGDKGGIAFSKIPQPKGLFGVRFLRNQVPLGKGAGYSFSPSVPIKSIDLPSMTFDLQELNEYNRTRLVQTKVHYQPVTMKLYDTVNQEVADTFWKYMGWYYGDFVSKTDQDWAPDQVEAVRNDTGGGWGLYADEANVPGNQYFFKSIDVFELYGGNYRLTQYIHPMLESISYDTANVEDGFAGKEIGVTFRYEGVSKETGKLDSELAAALSLDKSDHGELPSMLRNLLEQGIDIFRNRNNLAAIAQKIGFPFPSLLQKKITATGVASDLIRVVTGSSSLGSYGSFNFGNAASVAPTLTTFAAVAGTIGAVANVATDGQVAQTSKNNYNNITLGGDSSATVTNTGTNVSNSLAQQVSGTNTTGSTTITGGGVTTTSAASTVTTGSQTETAMLQNPNQPVNPGVSVNKVAVAKGIVQTSPTMSPELTSAMAAALVEAAARTGNDISDIAQVSADNNLVFTAHALAEFNRLKPSSAQIGIRGPNLVNPNDPDRRSLDVARRAL